MDRRDIRELRAWHAAAAKRAQQAGFDIVYVYATHGYLLSQFLSTVTNTRTDEYGGSVENRTRIVRELLTETREAVGEHCAVALRLSVAAGGDDPDLPGLEAHQAIIESIGDLADVWDLTVDDYGVEMGHSRFQGEASLSPFVAYVRALTDKPIVTVGRFTSPDTMVAQIRNGVADFIGAARPSIADPFLPAKIDQGRLDDIRECIGCNICYANNSMSVRLRCTQNPTMGEEWRLGWHPERVPSKSSDDTVLIVGAGPAGLEAARALGERGYAVTLAETDRECGGRVTREAWLPGLSEWARVRDYRLSQLLNLANVDVYRASHLSADDVLEFGFSSVLIATGATWRRDGLGRWHASTASIALPPRSTFTPDDIMAGKLPEGRVLLFDDDHYYMGSVLAERLVENGNAVVFVTPATMVAAWGRNTNEQYLSQRRLIELGVELCLGKVLTGFEDGVAHIDCVYSGNASTLEADAVLCVTSRAPDDALFIALDAERGGSKRAAFASSSASVIASHPAQLPPPCTAAIAPPGNSAKPHNLQPSRSIRSHGARSGPHLKKERRKSPGRKSPGHPPFATCA